MGLLDAMNQPAALRPNGLLAQWGNPNASPSVMQGLLTRPRPDISTEKKLAQALLDFAAPTTGTATEAITRALPIAGESWAANDAGNAFNEGNYGQAALMAGLGLLPLGGTMAAALRRGPGLLGTAGPLGRQRGAVASLGGQDVISPAMKEKPISEYQISHRPMTVEGGAAPLHALDSSFGPDIYSPNALQYFGSGDKRERDVLRVLEKVRGKPDSTVSIYRGVPDGVSVINPGDWVTLDPRVASDYGKVVKMEVPASHITGWGDSLLEFGYHPPK